MQLRLLYRRLRRSAAQLSDDSGASAVEYALIVALIAVVITVGVAAFGTSLNTFFSGLWSNLGL